MAVKKILSSFVNQNVRFSGSSVDTLCLNGMSATKRKLLYGENGTEVWKLFFNSGCFKFEVCVKACASIDMRKMIKTEQSVLEYLSNREGVGKESILLPICIKKNSRNPLIMFPYISGGDLTDYAMKYSERFKQMRLYEFLDLGIQIAQAIKFIHDNQIVHLDIKLDNVLVEERMKGLKLKLTDFGYARRCGSHEKLYDEHMFGSVVYSAPEVIHKKQVKIDAPRSGKQVIKRCSTYSQKADIFAFGVSLCFLNFLQITDSNYPFEARLRVMQKWLENGRQSSTDPIEKHFFELIGDLISVEMDSRPSIEVVYRDLLFLKEKDSMRYLK